GVDLIGLLDHLVSSGVRLVLCEGGPSLLGQLHRADLIDEIFVTTSPTMVGGADTGILGHSEAVLRNRRLHRLWLDDEGALLATWRRS
ncbi:MAG TPA: dihydrofolate reductase family protein, partial [Microthrixaceae bacterium]|nr:dihydrofolate reductase family protein [Microthrixaceae bacterium]